MNSKTCLSLGCSNIKDFFNNINKGEKYADLIELRLDYIKNIDEEILTELLKNKKKPSIITCRLKKEGGKFEGEEEKRFELLNRAMALGCDYLDIEYSASEKTGTELLKNKKKTKIICSWHNFKETPSIEEMEKIYRKIKKLNPDLIKIVTRANSINDNFKIFEFLKNKKDLISFSMGIKGQISRILAPKYGSLLTYGSINSDKTTADGQITIDDLKKVYNIDMINENTGILGVIGSYAENSLSRYIHNTNFRKQHLNYIYIPFKIDPAELPEFMINFRKFSFAGAAVTIPHKIEIMKYMDKIEDIAKKIGAVNTVVNREGKLAGYNTDYTGAIKALEEKISLENKKALVLGAGGASRAICYALKEKGLDFVIANRTLKKAESLAKELNVKFCSLQDINKYDYHIVINSTAAGMYPDTESSIIDKKYLKGKIVFDMVYRPMITKMLREGKEMGATIVEGYLMLLYQGIRQYKLWTGKEPDVELSKRVLFKQLKIINT